MMPEGEDLADFDETTWKLADAALKGSGARTVCGVCEERYCTTTASVVVHVDDTSDGERFATTPESAGTCSAQHNADELIGACESR